MARSLAPALAVMAVFATACGRDEQPLPGACTDGASQVASALRAAPGPVALADGMTLSGCVERARTDAEIQTLGATLTPVADHLARRATANDGAALRLGYLIGATRRGARRTNGIHRELVRRLEQTLGIDGPPAARRRAFQRGEAAGARHG